MVPHLIIVSGKPFDAYRTDHLAALGIPIDVNAPGSHPHDFEMHLPKAKNKPALRTQNHIYSPPTHSLTHIQTLKRTKKEDMLYSSLGLYAHHSKKRNEEKNSSPFPLSTVFPLMFFLTYPAPAALYLFLFCTKCFFWSLEMSLSLNYIYISYIAHSYRYCSFLFGVVQFSPVQWTDEGFISFLASHQLTQNTHSKRGSEATCRTVQTVMCYEHKGGSPQWASQRGAERQVSRNKI